jgi:microcystin-dependent protein
MEIIIGMVMWFTGTFSPVGFLEANGQCLSIQQNTVIYSVMGTRYGGDGRNNFCLPDLRPMDSKGVKALDWNNGPRALIATQGIYPSRP